jgi:hypothetical protein
LHLNAVAVLHLPRPLLEIRAAPSKDAKFRGVFRLAMRTLADTYVVAQADIRIDEILGYESHDIHVKKAVMLQERPERYYGRS